MDFVFAAVIMLRSLYILCQIVGARFLASFFLFHISLSVLKLSGN